MDNQKSGSSDMVKQSLKGVNYPASKSDLAANARDQGADDSVVAMIMALDTDTFNSEDDVMNSMNRGRSQGGQMGGQGASQSR